MDFLKIEGERGICFQTVGDIRSAPPVVFLHGIMGSKKNLYTFTKRFHDDCHNIPSIIIDLRNHGQSSKHWTPFTVEACAKDLSRLCQGLAVDPFAVVGHSFGGKVACKFAHMSRSIKQVWMLDCPPGVVHDKNPLDGKEAHTALDLLEILSEIKWPVSSRKNLVEILEERQVNSAIALWMTTNVVSVEGGVSLLFDPDELKEMLNDFIKLDCWSLIKTLAAAMVQIHLVAAEYGKRLTPADQKKLLSLAHVGIGYFHPLVRAGHFLHTDNPVGLIEIMKPFFDRA